MGIINGNHGLNDHCVTIAILLSGVPRLTLAMLEINILSGIVGVVVYRILDRVEVRIHKSILAGIAMGASGFSVNRLASEDVFPRGITGIPLGVHGVKLHARLDVLLRRGFGIEVQGVRMLTLTGLRERGTGHRKNFHFVFLTWYEIILADWNLNARAFFVTYPIFFFRVLLTYFFLFCARSLLCLLLYFITLLFLMC